MYKWRGLMEASLEFNSYWYLTCSDSKWELVKERASLHPLLLHEPPCFLIWLSAPLGSFFFYIPQAPSVIASSAWSKAHNPWLSSDVAVNAFEPLKLPPPHTLSLVPSCPIFLSVGCLIFLSQGLTDTGSFRFWRSDSLVCACLLKDHCRFLEIGA